MGDKVRLLRFQLASGNRLSLTGNFIKARIAHYPFPRPMAADVFRNSKRPSACVHHFGKHAFGRWPTLGPNNVVSADRTRNRRRAPRRRPVFRRT